MLTRMKPMKPSPLSRRKRKAAGEVPVLAAGESFGRYQIVRMLGKGAMGAVYLAYDSQLERHVALRRRSCDKPNIIAFLPGSAPRAIA